MWDAGTLLVLYDQRASSGRKAEGDIVQLVHTSLAKRRVGSGLLSWFGPQTHCYKANRNG